MPIFYILSAVCFAIGATEPLHKSSFLNWIAAGLCFFVVAFALV